MPEPSSSSTPAWDPNSHLPETVLEPGPLAGPSRGLVIPSSSKHILLDSRLLNAQLKVVVTGGSYNKKELTASIEAVGGQPTILFKCYKTSTPLTPDWVTPKHPNPTRDNGLLVVIKGDHCGKYVRRIHHRYEGDKTIMVLGVMNTSVDTLTEERLALEASDLCVAKEDKKKNRS
jgi:hypothetical protein